MARGTSVTPVASKREALLQAGKEVFFERGLANATIDEITSRAGVAKGTFYLYFASKDDLVKGLRDQLWDGMFDVALEAVDLAAKTDDLWSVVDHVIERVVDFDLTHREWHRFVAGGFHDPLLEDADKERRFIEIMILMIHRGVATGEFHVTDAEYAALLTYRAVEGVLHQLCLRDEPIDRERLIAAIREMTYRVLGRAA